jgi:hypothetical protein
MYRITESTVHNGHLLHRIEATSTMCFGNFIIKPGTKGGWIESESNLGETAWVADNAMVYDDAVVRDHAVAMLLSKTAQRCMAMRKLAIRPSPC